METSYVLGHSVPEIERLERQADILQHLTLRLLQRCGLAPGMSVLEIGTGAGDVAIAAARIVGGGGSVVGIDRSGPVLDRARARAEAARFRNLSFERVDFDVDPPAGTFDLVVCRYVLIHQPEPVDFLRRASLNAKGGRLAVLEVANGGSDRFSDPPVDVYDELAVQVWDAFEVAGVDLRVGGRLVDLFAAAGLAEPDLMSETPVGGPGSQVPELAVEVWKTMLPVLAKAGRRPVRDPGVLLDEVRSAASAKRAQLFLPRNVAGWVRVAS